MNEWRVLRFDEDESEGEDSQFWTELAATFETEHSWLADSDVQRLGQQHGVGCYMLLPPAKSYEPRIELTIAARQTFYQVDTEEPDVPEIPAGIEEGSSLDAVLDPRD